MASPSSSLSAEMLDVALWSFAAFVAIHDEGHLIRCSGQASVRMELEADSIERWDAGLVERVLPSAYDSFGCTWEHGPPWKSLVSDATLDVADSKLVVRTCSHLSDGYGQAPLLLMGARGAGDGLLALEISTGIGSSGSKPSRQRAFGPLAPQGNVEQGLPNREVSLAFNWSGELIHVASIGGCLDRARLNLLREAAELLEAYDRLPLGADGAVACRFDDVRRAREVSEFARAHSTLAEAQGWFLVQEGAVLRCNHARELGVADAYMRWGRAVLGA